MRRSEFRLRFLFAVNECDLDDGFSLWLRQVLSGPDELLLLQAMFATIGKHGCSGNMPLENLLNLLKMASKRAYSGYPHFERMCHAGVLAQQFNTFCDHGNEDSRRETRETSKKAGVGTMPNKWAKQRASKGQHSKRQHLSYMFARRAVLLREDPNMERQEAKNLAMEEWRSGNLSAVPAPKAKVPRKKKCAVEKPRERNSPLPCVWGPRWPLSSEALMAAVQEATGATGIARGCVEIRRAQQEKLFVKDCGAIPDSESFDLGLACSALHSGLCIMDDEVCFPRAFAMAGSIERWFKASATQGTSYILRDPDFAKERVAWVYFAARAHRKLQDQHVIVLARSESSAPGRELLFATRTCDDFDEQAARVLSFVTPGGLASEFATDGSSSLVAERIVIKNTGAGGMVYVRSSECGQVHPYIKPPKVHTASSAFDKLPNLNRGDAQRTKKPKAKRGKVSLCRNLAFRARVARKGAASSSSGTGHGDVQPVD